MALSRSVARKFLVIMRFIFIWVMIQEHSNDNLMHILIYILDV